MPGRAAITLFPGRTVDEAIAATGWPLRVADDLTVTEAPSAIELSILRDMSAMSAMSAKGQP